MGQAARCNTLSDWLRWLESRSPENTIELGLERIRSAGDAMDLLTLPSFVITVAGTNGKGSTIALLEAVLLAAGYTVGVMTSPHLVRFNERIRINGVDASDELLISAFSAINEGQCDSKLSYFEFNTLVAAHCFKYAKLDIVVLEVGMGGRLDAVNVFDSDIAVITTIGLDHQDYLGDSLEAIGREKAGIMRFGKPVVFGGTEMPASIGVSSSQVGAKLFQRGVAFDVLEHDASWSWLGLSASGEQKTIHQIPLPTLELDNAATALQALQLLPYVIKEKAVAEGFELATLSGRAQKLQWRNDSGRDIDVILDVSHNPQAVEKLVGVLKREACVGNTFAVLGMCSDKDIDGVLTLLSPYIDRWIATGFDSSRALAASDLRIAIGKKTTAEVSLNNNVVDGFTDAVNNADVDDRVLVTGSFMVVGAVLAHLKCFQATK